jgi:hypothetical protein
LRRYEVDRNLEKRYCVIRVVKPNEIVPSFTAIGTLESLDTIEGATRRAVESLNTHPTSLYAVVDMVRLVKKDEPPIVVETFEPKE